MELEKLSIEELDALTAQLKKIREKKFEDNRIEFIKQLITFLETATFNWDLFEVYNNDSILTVDDVIDRLHDYLNSL